MSWRGWNWMWCAGKVVSRLVSNWATTKYMSAQLLGGAFRKLPKGQYRYCCGFWYMQVAVDPPPPTPPAPAVTFDGKAFRYMQRRPLPHSSRNANIRNVAKPATSVSRTDTFVNAVPWRSTHLITAFLPFKTSHVFTVHVAASTSSMPLKHTRGVGLRLHSHLTSAPDGDAWSASRPCHFNPQRTAGAHWTEGWVDPRGGLDVLEKWKIFWLCRDANLGSSS
jgi:hypothetical protein